MVLSQKNKHTCILSLDFITLLEIHEDLGVPLLFRKTRTDMRCSNKQDFVVEKYGGLWHELLHYPTFFQRNDTYNTTAEYILCTDGSLDVLNKTFSNSKEVTSHGTARVAGIASFRVDFDAEDVDKFSTQGFEPPSRDDGKPNYVIKHIWLDDDGSYTFAVVTDTMKSTLWVLSRTPRPTRPQYEEILSYVTRHFDANKFVSTSHYED